MLNKNIATNIIVTRIFKRIYIKLLFHSVLSRIMVAHNEFKNPTLAVIYFNTFFLTFLCIITCPISIVYNELNRVLSSSCKWIIGYLVG